eukprot:3787283-Prymnesium_polylepis.1
MAKFLKEYFPNLEKPDFSGIQEAFSNLIPSPEPPAPIEVKEPSAAVVAAGKGMPLLGPVFSLEADLQALALNLGSYDVRPPPGLDSRACARGGPQPPATPGRLTSVRVLRALARPRRSRPTSRRRSTRHRASSTRTR